MTGASDAAYATLGLEAGAPFEEVRKRFLTLATQLHPDKATGSTETAHFSTVRCVPPRLVASAGMRSRETCGAVDPRVHITPHASTRSMGALTR